MCCVAVAIPLLQHCGDRQADGATRPTTLGELRASGYRPRSIREEMRDNLNPDDLPEYEAVAVTGAGVFETLKAVSKAVIKTLS